MSASGSKNFPNVVTMFLLLAMYPSNLSVIEAIIKIKFITQKYTGIPSHSPGIAPKTPKYPTITNIGTNIILKTVNLFAKFIFPSIKSKIQINFLNI